MYKKTIEKQNVNILSDSSTIIDNQSVGNQQNIIKLQNACFIHYILIIHPEQNNTFDFVIDDNNCALDLRILFLGSPSTTISSKITVHVTSSHTQATIHSIALLSDYSQLNLDARIVVDPGIEGVYANLLEENIFLGEHIIVHTLPLLDVRSNNVKVSHGAKVHKLDNNRLFYLQSKGLPSQLATNLFVQGYINKIFEHAEKNKNTENIIKNLYTQITTHA